MPQYSQSEILSALRYKYPNLSGHSDEQILSSYNRQNNLTSTGLPSASKIEAEEIPSYTPQHTGAGERFGKRFAEAAIPFAMYEPEMDEAEGFTEHLAGAIGGGLGFFAGAFPIAVLTGGLSIPLKAARGISLVSRIASKARAADKAGNISRSAVGRRSFEETSELLARWMGKGKIQPEAVSILASKRGILGKSEAYKRGIEGIAKKGEAGVKLAKAMDMGVQNFATFSIYGQTHMKPNSALEERWNQLKTDTVTAGLFTALGAGGTRVAMSHFTGKAKGAALTGEMFAMGIAGGYMTDMGQTDMPYEERLAHGITLMLLHGFGLGMDRAERREGIVEWLGTQGYDRTQATKIAYSDVTNKMEKNTHEYVKKDENIFIDKEYQKITEEVKVGRPSAAKKLIGDMFIYRTMEVDKPAKGKPYVQFEYFKGDRGKGKEDPIIRRGEIKEDRIYGDTIEEAQTAFTDRFARYRDVYSEEFPEQRLAKPEGITAEDKLTEKEIISENKKLRRASPEPGRPQVARHYDIKDTSEFLPEATKRVDESFGSYRKKESSTFAVKSITDTLKHIDSLMDTTLLDKMVEAEIQGAISGKRTVKEAHIRINDLLQREGAYITDRPGAKVNSFREYLESRVARKPEVTKQIVPKVDTHISIGKDLTNKIQNLEKAIENKQYVINNSEKFYFNNPFLRSDNTPWDTFTKSTLREESIKQAQHHLPEADKLEYSRLADIVQSVDRPKLDKLKQELGAMSEWEMGQPGKITRAELKIGDWGRIPLYEGSGTYSSRQASLGRYVGKYGDLDAKTKERVDAGGLEQTSVFDDALVFETFTPRGPERLNLIAVRDRDVKPVMRSELDPATLDRMSRLELQDAEKAIMPTELPGVSQKHKEEANYRFSLPKDLKLSDIDALKKGKMIHPDIINIADKLKKEGKSINSFIKELEKSGEYGVQLGRDVYYLIGDVEHRPKFEGIEIVPVEVERLVERPDVRGPVSQKETRYEVRFPAEHLPVEFNKGNYAELWRNEGVTPIEPAANVPAKLTPNQRSNLWGNIGVYETGTTGKYRQPEPTNVRKYSRAELRELEHLKDRMDMEPRGAVPWYMRNKAKELEPGSQEMMYTSRNVTFNTKEGAEAYVSSIKNRKYKKHVEFYKKESMTPKKEKALAENLENKQLTHREMTKEGGYIEQLTKKQLAFEENKIKEPASMFMLDSQAPYNPEVLSKIAKNFNVSIGRAKQLKLMYNRKGAENIRFNNGDLLDANFSRGFDTSAEAHQWAQKYWVGEGGSSSIEKAIAYRKGVIKSQFKGTPEWKRYGEVKKDAKITMSRYGAPYKSERMKNIIDTFFPEAKSNFDNLNTMELSRLNEMFRRDSDANFPPDKIDMGVPPDDITASTANPTWAKFVEWASAVLPTSVIQDATGSGGRYITDRNITFGRIQRIGHTQGQIFGIAYHKKLKPEHLEALHVERESKFEGARAGKHKETIEYLKNKEVKNVKVPIINNLGEVTGYEKGKTMTAYNYGNMILDKLFDDFAYRQALGYSKVRNPISNKYEPFIDIRTRDDIRIPVENIVKADLLAVMRGEKEKGDKIRVWNKAGTDTIDIKIESIPYNHYEPNYFPRSITQDFWDFAQTEEGNRYTLEKIIESNPEILAIPDTTPDQRFRRAAAEEILINLKGLTRDNKVASKIPEGQVFSRVANLEPWIYYDKSGRFVEPAAVFKEDGTPFKVNDTIKTNEGKSVTVGKAIQVYSADSADIINRYVRRTSRSIASYEAFGGPDGLVKPIPELGINIPAALREMKSNIVKSGMKPESAEWFENLSMRVMKDQIYGRDYDYPYLGKKFGPAWWDAVGGATRVSATIGLSFPLSGLKNFALGQTQLGVLSGREYLKAWYYLMTSPELRKQGLELTEAAGVRGGSTYDLFIKRVKPLEGMITKPKGLKDAGIMGLEGVREGLIKFGMMRPTEFFNRYMSIMMVPGVMKVHLDNLIGKKYFSNRGISKSSSTRVLKDILRFTDKEIDGMMKIRKSGGDGWTPKQSVWAADRIHSSTQGIGEHPYIPYIMGRDGFKPLTLFYRIAYRMTDHIANTVIKPAIYDGNIWPMMKYVGLSMAAGEVMYSTYWYAFGEERKNRFKDAPSGYWSSFIRAEGLGILSNAFDEHGDSVSDSYNPVVFRNFKELLNEAMNIMHGKKGVPEGVNSLLKKTVAAYSGTQRVYNNLTKATKKRVHDSRRRQSQFLDAYFPDYKSIVDANDALTRNSPYYEDIRNVFWLDTPEEKAHAYYTALNYLTHTIQRQDVALAKNEAGARSEAKKRIRNILSRIRPIPESWRKRGKGERTTKYRLYKSKITPEQIREDMVLDKLYKQKKLEFWRAVSQYR